MKLPYLSALACLTLCSSLPLAQTSTVVLRRGDSIPGYSGGTVTTIERFVVTNNAEWLAIVDTNNPDEALDEIVIRNGILTLQEGTSLASPTGATLGGFNSLNVDTLGDLFWDLTLVGPSTALYRNTRLVAKIGDPLNTVGFSRDASWLSFNGFVLANNNNQLLVAGEVNDSAIPGGSDTAMILITLDDDANIVSTVDVAHEKGQAPVLGLLVDDTAGIATGNPARYDLNDQGQVLWTVRVETGNTSFTRAIFLDGDLIYQQGDPSPVPGFNWLDLQSRVSLNNRGDWLIQGDITGPQNFRGVLVKNGELLLRERSTIPAIQPLLIDNFANQTPIFLADSGDAIYRLQWTGPGNTDTGIMINEEIIVREGLTNVEGTPIAEFIDGDTAIAASPSGRYMMYECTLEDDSRVVSLVDMGLVTPLDGCEEHTGTLRRTAGFPIVGDRVTLAMDEGQGNGVTPFLMVSDRPIFSYPPCGLVTSWGDELLIDFGANGNPFLLLIGVPWLGSEVFLNLDITNNMSLIDKRFYAQGIFFDITNQTNGAERLRLTNAVEIEIGAP